MNPYAEDLTFLDDRTRMRRDHAKYLTLIEVITLLRQHQREIKTLRRQPGAVIEYIEVTSGCTFHSPIGSRMKSWAQSS